MILNTAAILKQLIFFAPMVALLVLDIYLHRKNPHQSFKNAVAWTLAWMGLAFVFNIYIYFSMGLTPAINFLAGYVVEKSLSVDNLFVILMIFTYFNVPKIAQHRVLFWGIAGAFVFRGIFIFAGIALIDRFHWMIFLFGIFLMFTGLRTAFQKKEATDLSKNPAVKFLKKIVPITNDYNKDEFTLVQNGKKYFTPLLLALVVIELTDIVFAVDSIPAILAITTDPYIVVTSNFFAILGLRSLYFVLNHFLKYFHYLKYGLGFILVFVGFKMIIVDWYKFPVFVSLLIILFTLFVTIVMSMAFPPKKSDLEH